MATHRPLNAEAINHALAGRADLPQVERTESEALRDQDMQEHEAGDHRASEATLAEVMRRLLLADLDGEAAWVCSSTRRPKMLTQTHDRPHP